MSGCCQKLVLDDLAHGKKPATIELGNGRNFLGRGGKRVPTYIIVQTEKNC